MYEHEDLGQIEKRGDPAGSREKKCAQVLLTSHVADL